MGIESFYGQWISKVRYRGVKSSTIPSKVLSLLLDFNGILHEVAQRVYSYGNGKTTEQTRRIATMDDAELTILYLHEINIKLADLITKIRPLQTLVIAVDGVAPPAKLQQQRQRRYKEASGREDPPEDQRFNSSCITPGTEMMKKIDANLVSWIATNRELLPTTVIYSSHMVHGEGEHKIFNMIRHGLIADGDGVHAVYGLDADLNMLSLISPFHDNIVLIREDLRDVVSIGALGRGIVDDMNGRLLPSPIDLQIDSRLAIQDFVLMCYLAGNDFLPRIFAFYDIGETIVLMIDIYHQAVTAKREALTRPDGQINWDTMAQFLELLGQREQSLLEYKAAIGFKYPSTLLDEVSTKVELPSSDAPEHRRNPLKYEVTEFNFKRFRTLWYANVFRPRTSSGEALIEMTGMKVFEAEDIRQMCNWYLYGLQWILYYYRGDIDPRLYTEKPPTSTSPVILEYMYQYRYAPMLGDLATMCQRHASSGELLPLDLAITSCYIGAHHQLVAVMPPMSRSLIPEAQRHLIIGGGNLADMCPISFEANKEGRNDDYHPVLLLPTFDLDRLIAEVDATLKTRIFGTKVVAVLPFKEAEDLISHRTAPVFVRERMTRYPSGVEPPRPPRDDRPPRDGPSRGGGRGDGARGRGRGFPRGGGPRDGPPRGGGRGDGARGGGRGRGSRISTTTEALI